MLRSKGLSLRLMVNVLVLFTVIVTVTISAFIAYQSEKNTLFRTTFDMNQAYSEKISETVNSLFGALSNSLSTFGEHVVDDLTRPDLDELVELYWKGHSSFNAVFIIDRDGKIVTGTNMDQIPKGQVITSDGTQQALREKRPLVSEPYMSTTNKLIVLISTPMFDKNGEYVGFIGGSIRLHETDLFQTILSSSASQPLTETYPYVVSHSGQLLYHPDPNRIGEKITGNAVIDQLIEGHSGTMRVVNSLGVDMLASYSYIDKSGWGIVSQTPADLILASARKLILNIYMYMIPAILIIFAVNYVLISKLAEPFSKLAKFARQLSPKQSNNDELPKIHHWNDEANELHKALERAVRHFRYQYQRLYEAAQTDPLTGLFNRRTLDDYIQVWSTENVQFSLMVFDLDNFKRINDTYGHECGDEVLQFFANAVKKIVGDQGVCCRFGGEEFVVLVPSELLGQATLLAESIRTYMMDNIGPSGEIVTVSIGVAKYPEHATSADQLFHVADHALYQAKHNGRNQIVLAGQASRHQPEIHL
ncbi:MAG: sensor domain-containing diguanylate cyclase [Candidatus Cohnella colombiensis]|uniref:Sensor domain-containing diguanylate cyclase n=1 Tax=Candidatus Cohnella colombiensis TaxID=3121368 RepID=A0AA95EYV9_9BACL|nr:MAG: sensor domain-containing diguanylate cyclase [Cohnella sp.]